MIKCLLNNVVFKDNLKGFGITDIDVSLFIIIFIASNKLFKICE